MWTLLGVASWIPQAGIRVGGRYWWGVEISWNVAKSVTVELERPRRANRLFAANESVP
jgi:hypothetical protein